MRTNKKKLAALAMSVVMAASTMSLSAFAEETVTTGTETEAPTTEAPTTEAPTTEAPTTEAPTTEAPTTEAPTTEAPTTAATVTGVSIDKEGNVTVHWSDNKDTKLDEKATSTYKEATCTEPAKTVWEITVKGTAYKQEYPEGAALGHDWGEWERKIVDHGDCATGTAGYSMLVRTCSRCDKTDKDETSKQSVAATHNLTGESRTTTSNLVNLKIVNDEMVLVDSTKNGFYDVVTEKQCVTCKTWVKTETKTQTVYASTGVRSYSKVIAVTNIKSGLAKGETLAENKVGTDGRFVDEAKVVLTNCSNDATYTLEDFDANGSSLGTKTYTISARHSAGYPTAVGKTAADKALIQLVYDKNDPKLIVDVTSKSCYKTADYVWTVKCEGTTCSLKDHIITQENRVAQPAGAHQIKDSAKAAVDALVADAKINNGYAGQTAYDDFLEAANKTGSKIKYTANVECNKGGTVTITYICDECGKEITDKSVTVNIGKFDHKAGTAKQENRVEATCTTNGSYDSVTRCKYCDTVLATKKVTLTKLGHTNAKNGDKNAYIKFAGSVVVDDEGKLEKTYLNAVASGAAATLSSNIAGGGASGVLSNYSVKANVMTTCERCSGEMSINKTPTVTIVAIQKDAKGVGTITLKASYPKANDGDKVVTDTVTVPYYSDLGAYFDRNPEEEPINGLQLDADGVVRYYENSKFKADYAGIAEFNGGEFFVANGVVCSKANGLNEYKGTWYYLANGQIQRGYNGLALYDGAWFYLTNGVLNADVNGLVPYNGGTFLFSAGRLRNDVNGLWQNADGTWYFLALGQVQTQHTGVAIYDGSAFYVRNGKLAKDYKGTVVYDGATFNVVNGQLYGPVA